MLHFLVMADNRSPLRRYLRQWGEGLRGRTRLISYKNIRDPARLRDGTYVFSDIERLSPDGLAKAGRIWDTLAARGSRVRLLNSPHTILRRRELLQTLAATGRNRFNVYGIDEPREGIRYPVFLRSEREHRGPLTPMLNSEAELTAAIRNLVASGRPAFDLLIVEFLDTSVGGIFRKYSVTRIGDEILAQHAFHAKEWLVKSVRDWPAEEVRRDTEFVAQNPHGERLSEIFRLANIEFGRADYSMLDGEVQLWEINSNPTFFMHRSMYGPDRIEAKLALSRRLNAAMAALDEGAEPPGFMQRLAGYRDLWR